MTTTKEMILIGGVVVELSQRGSWTGETHIQKTCYLAKTLRHVPFESEYVLYKHGPFSFDMNKSIVHMRTRRILNAVPQGRYGHTFSVNEPMWKALNSAVGNFYEGHQQQIASIAEKTAKLDVAALERLSTAVLILHGQDEALSDEEVAERLTEVKPHIPLDLARAAATDARALST